MMRNLFLLLSIFLCALCAQAQESYSVGVATRSIEPDQKSFSLSLSGFAAPKEGRFSLTWKKVDAANGNLSKELRQLAATTSAKAMAATKLGSWYYRLDAGGNLYRATSPRTQAEKITTTQRGKLVALTTDGYRLYALNSNDSIWRIDLSDQQNPWQLIGRNNNTTYAIHLTKIACIQNQLYGVAGNGDIYQAAHATDNSMSVTAMSIGYQQKKILIIGLDLTGFPGSYIQDIKAIISKKHSLPPEAILVNASHTHFAPVTAGWTTWESFYQYPDSSYLNGIKSLHTGLRRRGYDPNAPFPYLL